MGSQRKVLALKRQVALPAPALRASLTDLVFPCTTPFPSFAAMLALPKSSIAGLRFRPDAFRT